MAETEYMVRASGYLKTLEDFRQIPLRTNGFGIPVTLGDVATIQLGPEMRRGISEYNGQGESVGGVIILRAGKNARQTIAAAKEKLAELQRSLPKGVQIVPVYDRSQFIDRAVENLSHKLIEEFIVVALVCGLFLWHLRSAMVAIVSLPLGVLSAFLVMHYQGLNANIMSLGGIAIAIGAMVDAAVVMVENAHKHIEAWQHEHPDHILDSQERWSIIARSASEVGPALFFCLLIITLSFIPIFTLQAQEGRLFSPLALTKTYAMAAAAGLSITLIPVLMGYWIRGKLPSEQSNPLNRFLIKIYRPMLDKVLEYPKLTLLAALIVFILSLFPLTRLGGEFLPNMDEGDLLYMPSALPGLSAAKASELLQQTDRMIKTVPEVATVFGKAGRAESATDPAPLEMFETTIQFKPRSEWRSGMTPEKLVKELDKAVQVPGLTNIWDHLFVTGLICWRQESKVQLVLRFLRVALVRLIRSHSKLSKLYLGVSSALAERLTGGRYVDVDINRIEAARYGLNINDIQKIVASAIGGENVGETVEGLARYPINVRYPREIRDSLEALRNLPILTESGQQIILSSVADIQLTDGPPMLKSENARPSGWVYVDVQGRDLASVVKDLKQPIDQQVKRSAGMSISYSGQFEFMERANARLKVVIPITLMIIFLLLYLIFRQVQDAVLIMVTLPFALIGGIWAMYLSGYNFSVAIAVGFIALAGVAAEFGVVMLFYLKQAIEHTQEKLHSSEQSLTEQQLNDAIRTGAVLRVRPKAMTVAVILAGLLPILWGTGTGSELMSRIALPMVGGMISAPLLSMFVIPAAYQLLTKRKLSIH
jgi:Cu(I)/Ag(I) efflux system membrane protein CusA/SilA